MLHKIQVLSFASLLEKYQDFATNPGAETLERVIARFERDFTAYYLIYSENTVIGMLRVCDYGDVCRLSPICILPEFQGNGYGRQAMILAEALYPNAVKWTLDTILQEEKLCRMYEKCGYRPTGERRTIRDGMELVFYEKLRIR